MLRPASRRAAYIWGILIACGLIAAIAFEIAWTAPVRGAVRTYGELISAANRQDLPTLGRLCSDRYRRTHPLRPSEEGGVIGFPRNIHKNYQAWRHEKDVYLCPSNRVGPIYGFVRESGSWKFDGVVGLLRPGGIVVPWEESEAG